MPELLKLRLENAFFPKLLGGMKAFQAIGRKLGMERMKEGVDVETKDVISHLLQAKDPESGEGFQEDGIAA